MAFAHSSGLTHNALDNSQILVNHDGTIFKVTNFRPWVTMARKYASVDGIDLNDKEKTDIAMNRDIYSFGVAVFDLITCKASSSER